MGWLNEIEADKLSAEIKKLKERVDSLEESYVKLWAHINTLEAIQRRDSTSILRQQDAGKESQPESIKPISSTYQQSLKQKAEEQSIRAEFESRTANQLTAKNEDGTYIRSDMEAVWLGYQLACGIKP